MGFDFSEARVLVAGIAEAAHKKPLHRITLQFEPERSIGRHCLKELLEFTSLGDEPFDHAARDPSSLLAYAVAEFGNARSVGAARAIYGFGRDIEACHDAWELAHEIQFRDIGCEAEFRNEDETAAVRYQ